MSSDDCRFFLSSKKEGSAVMTPVSLTIVAIFDNDVGLRTNTRCSWPICVVEFDALDE